MDSQGTTCLSAGCWCPGCEPQWQSIYGTRGYRGGGDTSSHWSGLNPSVLQRGSWDLFPGSVSGSRRRQEQLCYSRPERGVILNFSPVKRSTEFVPPPIKLMEELPVSSELQGWLICSLPLLCLRALFLASLPLTRGEP